MYSRGINRSGCNGRNGCNVQGNKLQFQFLTFHFHFNQLPPQWSSTFEKNRQLELCKFQYRLTIPILVYYFLELELEFGVSGMHASVAVCRLTITTIMIFDVRLCCRVAVLIESKNGENGRKSSSAISITVFVTHAKIHAGQLFNNAILFPQSGEIL
jgi:hypothetical protein